MSDTPRTYCPICGSDLVILALDGTFYCGDCNNQDIAPITEPPEPQGFNNRTEDDRNKRLSDCERELAAKSAECQRLREAVEHVLTASEDGGNMSDIDWSMLRAALQETQP